MTKRYTGLVYWRPKGELAKAVELKPLARVLIQETLDRISYRVGGTGFHTLKHETPEGIIKVIAQQGSFPGEAPRVWAELIPYKTGISLAQRR
jgi:hypothetical protein